MLDAENGGAFNLDEAGKWLDIHTAIGISLARGPQNVTEKHFILEYNIDSRRRRVSIPASLDPCEPDWEKSDRSWALPNAAYGSPLAQ